MMLAIVGAGISPACKFISGDMTWMEICGVDGIKKVLVSGDDLPAGQEQEHAQTDPCAFCLTHASVKTAPANPSIITAPYNNVVESYDYSRVDTIAAIDLSTINARAPPHLS